MQAQVQFSLYSKTLFQEKKILLLLNNKCSIGYALMTALVVFLFVIDLRKFLEVELSGQRRWTAQGFCFSALVQWLLRKRWLIYFSQYHKSFHFLHNLYSNCLTPDITATGRKLFQYSSSILNVTFESTSE